MQTDRANNLKDRLPDRERQVALGRWTTSFSRWARGGMAAAGEDQSPGIKGIVRRGLVNSAQPQSAQSIVEFLLVSVPLLALIFGILEFGLAFFESTNLDFAAREVARTTAVCSNNCDNVVNGVLYRDYYGLQVLNTLNTNLENLEYVLIQHVGEQEDNPSPDGNPNTPGTPNYGRLGPDIYANYQYHWQLYALPKSYLPASNPRRNTVPARSSDPDSLRLADALPSQIPLLNSNNILKLNPDGSNAAYNGWRSNRCTNSSQTGGCRQNIPQAKVDGTIDNSKTPITLWTGRYVCVPSDRFYVQLVYRHNWITPFLPTVDLSGRQTLRGFGNTNALILSSKVYQKVEPQLYSQIGGGC